MARPHSRRSVGVARSGRGVDSTLAHPTRSLHRSRPRRRRALTLCLCLLALLMLALAFTWVTQPWGRPGKWDDTSCLSNTDGIRPSDRREGCDPVPDQVSSPLWQGCWPGMRAHARGFRVRMPPHTLAHARARAGLRFSAQPCGFAGRNLTDRVDCVLVVRCRPRRRWSVNHPGLISQPRSMGYRDDRYPMGGDGGTASRWESASPSPP